MFVMLNNSVEDSCVCLICVACTFLDFFVYTSFYLFSLFYYTFFPDERVDATSFEFFVMMYVYIIRKIIVTIVKFNFNTKD